MSTDMFIYNYIKRKRIYSNRQRHKQRQTERNREITRERERFKFASSKYNEATEKVRSPRVSPVLGSLHEHVWPKKVNQMTLPNSDETEDLGTDFTWPDI